MHIGDYSSHTGHLSLLEDLAYRRLIDRYYLSEKPLPADVGVVARQIGMRDHLDEVGFVLSEFFRPCVDGWRHERCDREIEIAREKTEVSDARKENEKERQRRHRERRKDLFKQLRDLDVVPDFDTSTESLQNMLVTEMSRVTNARRDGNATANQSQEPIPNTSIKDQNTFAESGKPPPAPPKSPKASFDYSTGRFENLSSEMVQAWTESCPAIDVRLEIAKAKAWLLANPKNRKSNIERFLNTWLTKAQDKAPRANGNGQHQQPAQQRVDNSAAGRVRANIAAARAARGEVDRTDLGPDVVDVRPQVGEQLRGSGGPGQGMGSVLEGDFTRAD